MLKTMRRHAKYFYVLFFIVILTFIFWGVGPLDKPTEVSVAEIGDEKITIEDYWRAHETARQRYREMYRDKFDEEMEKNLNLKETVLNNLVDEKVLLISAKEMGLTVTDKELQEAVINDPAFIRDGVFKKDVYLRVLDLNRLTPEMFETSMRQQLLALKMRRLIGSSIDLSDTELKGMSGDEKLISQLRQAILQNRMDSVVKSYVDNAKQKITIRINKELIS